MNLDRFSVPMRWENQLPDSERDEIEAYKKHRDMYIEECESEVKECQESSDLSRKN